MCVEVTENQDGSHVRERTCDPEAKLCVCVCVEVTENQDRSRVGEMAHYPGAKNHQEMRGSDMEVGA